MATTGAEAGFKKRLIVKVTVGAEAPEKLSQAFTVASVAAASGFDISLWLTGDATRFALPGEAETFSIEGAKPLREMLDVILAAGTVSVCSQCAARRSITGDQLIAGATIRGASSFVEEIMQNGSESLVY